MYLLQSAESTLLPTDEQVGKQFGLNKDLEQHNLVLEIPRDVQWFIPQFEGWLCDYEYVRDNNTEEFVMRILPRKAGLGRIMVYPIFYYADSFISSRIKCRWGFSDILRGEISRTSTWVLVALSPHGDMDRFFLTTANYGDSKAMLEITTSLKMYQLIPLATYDSSGFDLTLGKNRFPGITAVNATVSAYGESSRFFGSFSEQKWFVIPP